MVVGHDQIKLFHRWTRVRYQSEGRLWIDGIEVPQIAIPGTEIDVMKDNTRGKVVEDVRIYHSAQVPPLHPLHGQAALVSRSDLGELPVELPGCPF